jgi:3-deoxy-D-manno-octulosonic-acid transferase
MTLPEMRLPPKDSIMLRSYIYSSRAVTLFAPFLLRRRLARGKEDHQRWREKLGEPGLPRPTGSIIWLHAVGLGEILALRGLIAEMADLAPDASFLVTSTARSSASVFKYNLPPRCQHQFLPLDAPRYIRQFLDHWRPELAIWAEQDLWPGAVVATHARGVPLALVNARLTANSFQSRMRIRTLYSDILARFSLVSAQDEDTAWRLQKLGANDVRVDGAFKAAAPPLVANKEELDHLKHLLSGRRIWVAASTHSTDETIVFDAADALPDWLLILAPRDIGRAASISAALSARGLSYVLRSEGGVPDRGVRVLLADTYGELGLWYRLADAAFIGGSFDGTEGHNPWEAAALGAAILHGPNIGNFRSDYTQLHQSNAARKVSSGTLVTALEQPDLVHVATRAKALVSMAQGKLAPLARDLLKLLPEATR